MASLLSMPYVKLQWFDNNGEPAAGYQIWTYAPGTSTHQTTWSDAGAISVNSNPVVLDSAGRADIFIDSRTYKFVMASPTDLTDPPTSPIWTVDGVRVAPTDIDLFNIVPGETVANGDWVYLSSGSGGKVAGRWYLTDATNAYSSTTASGIGWVSNTSGPAADVRIEGSADQSPVTAGSVYYLTNTPGTIATTAGTNVRVAGVALDSDTILISSFSQTVVASATVPGLVGLEAQTWTGTKTLAPNFSNYPTGLGAYTTSYASADTTKNNNTTLVNVTGLLFTTSVANAIYFFQFVIHCISATAADIKFTLTGPAAATGVRFGTAPFATTDTTSANAFASVLTLSTSGADETFVVSGQLRNGANTGDVQFQFAQATADASNSKVYADSSVIAWRIG